MAAICGASLLTAPACPDDLANLVDTNASVSFSVHLHKGGLTSAGVLDGKGRLVRTLRTMKRSPRGRSPGPMGRPGRFRRPAAAGDYKFKVVVNRSVWNNVGAIGSDGLNRSGHVPADMEAVAVDADGAVYTANGWEESGADFKKWDLPAMLFTIRRSRSQRRPERHAVLHRHGRSILLLRRERHP